MNKIKTSLKNVNLKLYMALLFLGLCPTIYTTVRTNFLGQLPGDYSYSIAGQLSWVSLIYEVINEAIILPLFYFLGRGDKKEFSNRIRSGLCITAAIYTFCAVIVSVFTMPLLKFMAVSPDIINESATYICLESIAFIFTVLFDFTMVGLVTIGKEKSIYLLTIIKCLLCITFDTLFVSTLPISLNLGVNGIAFSNILASLILFVITIIMIHNSGYDILSKEKMSFTWMKEFAKVGGISGLESFVRNIAYLLMVSRMVNMVGEQGTYWVANNFIWGWLLLPVLQLGELIKRDIAEDIENVKKNTAGYYFITGIICVIWIITIPLYKPFMANVLGYSDVDKLYHLVMILLFFYVCFAFQNIFDATFYGAGKTNYMLFESVVTNSIYYGAFFIAYKTGLWIPSLTGIALMFGFGNLFDSVVSWGAYKYFLKTNL